MNLIKIAMLLKSKFPEFYEIKHYKKHSSEQFIIKNYPISSQKIIVDEER